MPVPMNGKIARQGLHAPIIGGLAAKRRQRLSNGRLRVGEQMRYISRENISRPLFYRDISTSIISTYDEFQRNKNPPLHARIFS